MSGIARTTTCITLALWLFVETSPRVFADHNSSPRTGVPDTEAQAKAALLIKDAFKPDYADHSPDAKERLASKLLQQAEQTPMTPSPAMFYCVRAAMR